MSVKQLCWFCGLWRPADALISGRSLGQVILGSDSLDSSNSSTELCDEEWKHIQLDEALICDDCLSRARGSLGKLDTSYLEQMSQVNEAQFSEMFDYETGLIESSQRTGVHSCFFSHCTAFDQSKIFYGKSFAELFELGFRFKGVVKLNDMLCESFCRRMQLSRHQCAEFSEHSCKHLIGVSKLMLDELGRTKTQILDFSVDQLLRSTENIRRPSEKEAGK